MINLENNNHSLNITNILSVIKKYGNPIWIYDSKIIANQIQKLKKFDVIRFAQKACSNIHILQFMKNFRIKLDAVSLGEIERALTSNFQSNNDEIIFTADIFDKETLLKIVNYKITVNAGSLDMLKQLGKISPGHKIWIRINPKFGHGHNKKTNTGGENSKHGIWNPMLAIPIIKKYKLQLVGLHMHIGSGVDYQHLQKVCNAMVKQAKLFNQDIKAISAGGGLSIPYKITDIPVDTEHYFKLWNSARNKIQKHFKHPIQLEIEPGRFLVAESGILVAEVYAIKYVQKKRFTLINVGFNDLLRPVLYGSYHHISVISKKLKKIQTNNHIKTIIAGPLCESGDIFTQNEHGELIERELPEIHIGDYIVFHDTGAYGASMSSNYNTRPLIPEILFINNTPKVIRRRQTIEDILKLEIDISE
ncbi:diaminopimelate decarboxylase [Buchnera aphidicola]|uniref:diaminopimelate decarboxylase n=1 Tax=Buchnera aphidicola TaxID=9 RepID=UPI003464AF36